MFYSSRYFWRTVVILVLVVLITFRLPEVLNSLKSFVNFITLKFSWLANIVKMK